jgi:negative regulator of flagellin synthesis FlgM
MDNARGATADHGSPGDRDFDTQKGDFPMEIHGAGGAQGPQPIYPRLAAFGVDAGSTVHAGSPRDHVEISPLGQMLDGISRLPEIRQEKVEEIRRQIADGTYETPEKIQVALDRLLDELSGFSSY